MSSSTTPIAIVGVSAEFPSGEHDHNLDYADYWRFLLNKGEAFSPIPSDRFNYEAFSHLITPKSGAFLTQPTLFDSLEFGIPPADAAALPLATRKLIEHAFLALRDAGINYRGADVGVYTAGVGHDASVLGEADPHALTGTFASIPATIANRVSYHLDLHGPSLPVDTACSSSLTATHLAVQALRAGECESAVVGGAQINLRLNEWIQYSQSGVLSKDGKCKPFDANADGFARGEGVACIILKPLDKAIKDGDRVYATILGSAINAAGSLAPLNAPVAGAQQAAMTRAYIRAGKSPVEADFVEMHATGTAAGDPTEANWVGEQFKRQDGAPLFAGSVKGNIGHTEITAFLASLLKVTHMVEHNVIPPTANFSVPNRKIRWEEFNLHVPSTAPIPFTPRASSGKALISLSSFGIGGANGHVVLEGPAPHSRNTFGRYDRHGEPTDAILIMAGGLSPRSAGDMAEQIRELFMNAHRDSLPLLSKLSGRQARQLTWRSYALYYPNLQEPKAFTFCEAQLAPRTRPPLAFVFSGQGPQHALMGRQLFSKYPAFRKSVYECDEAYRSVMGFSLVESSGLFVEPRDNATSSKPAVSSEWTVTLPALTILQIALFDLLGSFGIKPDVVLGHSAGETALLYASGAAPKEMAVQVAIARAKMMSVAESVGGGMAAVACGEVEAQGLIDEILAKEGIFEQAEREHSLVLACYNSPDGVSVAGLIGLVDKLCALAESRGVLARRLRIPVPVHSYLMDVCKAQCENRVGEVFARFPQAGKPTTTMYSTVTGHRWDEPFSVDYFWRNARQAVLFNQVTTQLVDKFPNMCYVEISPHPVLSSYISSAGVDSSRITCPSRRPARSGEFLEGAAFLESLGRLAMNGYDVDFNSLNHYPEWDPTVKLPPYPFNKKDVPFHVDTPSFHRLLLARNGPLNHPRLRINAKTHPLLAGHVVNSEPIMPAAGFIEMALEFGARVLSDVEFMAALPLSADVPSTVEVALDGAQWSVKTSSALGHGSDKSWVHRGSPDFDRLHSRGLLTFNTDNTDDEPLNLTEIQARCKRVCRIEDLYEHGFKGFADYGSDFKRMIYAVQGQDEVFATLRGAVDLPDCDKYRFDPVILDAVFHGCMFFLMEHEQVVLDYETRDYFLPSRAARVVLHDALARACLPEQIAAHFVLKDWTPAGISVDISITDIAGERLCTIRSFEMSRHSNSIQKPVEKRYQLEWQPVSIPLQPAGELHHVRELKRNTRDLWLTLDALAIETIKKTLSGSVVPGAERHRQRYWEFAKDAATKAMDKDALEPERIATLRQTYPSYFDVTDRVGKVHADIFTSSTATVQALYSNVEIMQDFYGAQNTVIPSCQESAVIFRNLLKKLAASGKKVIRVLEVGCGTGMLTQHLVDVLPDFPDLIVEYVATDISLGLAMQAAQRFAHPYMRAAAYDLTKTLEEQGITPASFDVVSALHVLHATSDLAQTMGSISDLLVPGGYVLTVDFDGEAWQTGTPGTIWYDFIFGGFQEWFDFGEDRTSHCTVSLGRWRRLLQGSGFNCVTFSSSHLDEDHSLVFLAQKAGTEHCVLPIKENARAPSVSSSATVFNVSPSSISKDLSPVQVVEEFVYVTDPIFNYLRGQEMKLRDELARLDASDSLSVWIVATDGPDGEAARGLIRTLGKELPAWKIHLVICDASWSMQKRRAAVAKLQDNPATEPEIRVDINGVIHVPRVVPLPPPSLEAPFESNKHWVISDAKVSLAALPALGPFDIAVEVSHWSSLNKDTPRAFVGTVSNKGTSDFATGDWVMGFTDAPFSNRLVVPGGSVVPCQPNDARVLPDAAGLASAVLALGPGTLRRMGRLQAIQHVLVTDADSPIGRAAARLYVQLGLDVFCIAGGNTETDAEALAKSIQVPVGRVSVASNALWVARQRCRYDVVLSGARNKPDVQSVTQLCTPQGILHLWNSESDGLLANLKRDPWLAAFALEVALQNIPPDFCSYTSPVAIADAAPVADGTLVTTKSSLFDPRKTYVLIGGIGGMGVQMALWMYENGARDIVLTSRRGRESLRRTNQTAGLRTVQYLERLTDLSLSLEAVDATDYEATAALIKSLRKPVGGCFLMSLVLSDKSFANQTEDDFEKVFEAKTTAFQNLSHAIDINTLDFLVSFSSVAALFGSAGQSNYTSASSALEGMTNNYRNAFSLVVPGITDSGWLVRDQRGENSRSSHLLQWGMSTRELCDCIADGIRKLQTVPFNQYVPNLNWNLVRQDMGALPSFQHLCVAERTEAATLDDGEEGFDMEEMVRIALNIPAEDFSPHVPFTAYGLDSLVAVRLSAAIRAHTGLKVSQLQLLADMTLEDLERKLDDISLEADLE